MMICWYQPTEVMNTKRLIHLCPDDGRGTLCGLKVNYNWILWGRSNTEITCKKCSKLEGKHE
jgi:hypothetical protein